MCSHADCRVETMPDGQIDETHVFTNEQMEDLAKATDRLSWKLKMIQHYGPVGFMEVVSDGYSWTSP